MKPRVSLKMAIPSFERPGYVHPAGSEGSVAEQLNTRIWVLCIEVVDPDGQTWTENLDVLDHEFEFVALNRS